jgi:ankyrin repeat protein
MLILMNRISKGGQRYMRQVGSWEEIGAAMLAAANSEQLRAVAKQVPGAPSHQLQLLLLVLAAAKGFTEVVKVLLEREADVDIEDENGATALHLAAAGGHLETVEVGGSACYTCTS